MFERFERRKTWRRCLAALYVISFGIYLAWRFTIIAPESLFLSVMFYVADWIGFILGMIGIITTWDYNHRDPLPCPPNLSVDVFVTTFREPLHIIRRTVLAAKALDYPHTTWVLDDGKRDEVMRLAEELGLRYLRRPDSKNAKAGNLNYGFANSSADFIMSIDADHIVLPHALNIMLGFFADENVALVQTPQDYYNTDAFQYMKSARTKGLWHDQSSYYNIIEPCGDKINAATCIGTGVVYRRSAIRSIGGIPTDSITEDIHTSLKLQKKGYRIVFINEPVAYGMAEADLGEFCKVRRRWAHGNIHAVEVENIRFCKGLNWRQRLQYMALELVYLEGWQQLILLMVPIVALFFGVRPFQISIFNMLIVLLFPLYIALLTQEGGCGFTRYWAGQILSMARWPIHILAFAGFLRIPMPFRSSSKNNGHRINWRLMAPQMTVMALSLSAVLYSIFRLHRDFHVGALFKFMGGLIATGHVPDVDIHAVLANSYNTDLVAVAGFWALFAIVRGGCFIQKVLYAARNNHDFFRFHLPMPVILHAKTDGYGCISAISEDWVRFTDYREGPHAVPSGAISLTIAMPAGPLPVKVAVERVEGRVVEGRLVFDSERQRDMLANGLYSVDWHREFQHRNAYFLTPTDLVMKCLRLWSPLETDHGPWRAALWQGKGDPSKSNYAIMANFQSDAKSASFVTFQKLDVGDEISGILFCDGGMKAFCCLVAGLEPLSSLVEKGLDGAAPARYRVSIVA